MPINSLRANVISSLASRAVQALGLLVFTPVYKHLLGLDGLAVIMLWVNVRGLLMLFDFGMSTTLNREIAAARATPEAEHRLWSSFRTLEAISWSVVSVITLVGVSSTGWVNSQWLHTTGNPEIQIALALIAVASACQLPVMLYQGGQVGLERQVPMNIVVIVFSLVRDIGSIVVLILSRSSIVAFFAWQAGVVLALAFVQRLSLTRGLPRGSDHGQVDFSLLKSFGKFTAGTGMTAVTVFFLTFTDSAVLLKAVPLAAYGVYGMAQAASGAVLLMVSPLSGAAFPRMTGLVVQENWEKLQSVYHEFSQFISVAVFPICAVFMVFPSQVLYLWTGDRNVAQIGQIPLFMLAAANGLNSLLYLPLQAQYAHKWTSLTLIANLVSVILYVPVVTFMATRFGIVGAGTAYMLQMAGQLAIIPALMHRKVLKGTGWTWYFKDLLLPALPCILLGFMASRAIPADAPRFALILWLGAFWVVASGLTLLASPVAFERLRSIVASRRQALA